MNLFDELARSLAAGTSRRQILRGLVTGLTGIVLSSLGFKSGKAAALTPICGTCQACDIDSGTCGMLCNPVTAGQTLCNQAGRDGSYLRLAYYLTTHGFAPTGASNSIQLLQTGTLIQSVLATTFANSSVSAQTAFITYSVSPKGDVTPAAFVLQNGAALYALSVGPNGQIVQTVATHTSSNASSSDSLSALALNGAIDRTSVSVLHPAISQALCGRIVDVVCGVVALGLACYFIGDALCAAEGLGTALIGAIPCGMAVTVLCGLGDYATCEAAKDHICACPFNEQSCNGICCGPCMDCVNGACVPGSNVSSCQSGVCCNGQCCAPGFVCSNGTCTSANQCIGAVCGSFTPGCLFDNQECFCGEIAGGGGVCWCNAFCDEVPTCTTSADCPSGSVCAIDTCCAIPVCLSICTPGCTLGASTLARTESTARRPTAAQA